MKFTTIITSGYPLREIVNRLQEWAWLKIAARLPRRLAYWSFIVEGGRFMENDVVPEVPYMTLLERFGHQVGDR